MNLRTVLIATLLLQPSVFFAETVTEIYPGKRIRYEQISQKSNLFFKVYLNTIIDNNLSFKIIQFDRQKILEKPIFEKVEVVRNKNDQNDAGRRTIKLGETITGDLEERENLLEIGPIASHQFGCLQKIFETDENGILVDRQQIIISLYDDLKHKESELVFSSPEHGRSILKLTRTDLYSLFDVEFKHYKRSHPESLVLDAVWDKKNFTPGQIAEITLSVKNTAKTEKPGDTFLVLGRSMSRWPWLDGKMFYFGNFTPGVEKKITRLFKIPDGIPPGAYYLRIGLRDYSGEKLQIPIVLQIIGA